MSDDSLKQAFDRLWLAAEQRNWIPGRLGKYNGDGTVSVKVADRPNFVYVRLGAEGNQGVAIAKNLGVPLRAHLPIKMRTEGGVLVVHGVDHTGGRLEAFLGGADVGSYSVARHSHRIGTGLEYETEALLLEPGRIRWNGTGLEVYINPLRYFWNDAWQTWEGGAIDLSSEQPSTSGKWAWILVGIDPATNTATATAGSEVAVSTALDVADLDAIDFGDAIPCGAVRVKESDTTLGDIRRHADAGGWRNMGAWRADQILTERITGSTYSTAQDMQDIFHSAGYVSGGAVSDNGDGSVAVTAGTGLIRATDDELDTLLWFDWAASDPVALTDDNINYVYADYNSGSPVIAASTSAPASLHTAVLLAAIWRSGTDLHINETVRPHVGDHAANMIQRLKDVAPYAHVSGAILGETGTRNITVTAGEFWEGLQNFTTDAFDSSGADTFTYYYRDGGGGWTETSPMSQLDNANYDDGSGTLASLTANRYSVHWVYLAVDSDVHIVYGQGDYTLAQAQAASIPATIPPEVQADSFLIGKIVLQQGASSTYSIESVFTSEFNPAGVTDHGDLAGLADDDHTQYLLAAGTRALTGDWDIGDNRMIQADKIRARDGAGLALYEDGGAGVFVKDGGNVGIGTSDPNRKLTVNAGGPAIVGSFQATGGAFLTDFKADGDYDAAIRMGGSAAANVWTFGRESGVGFIIANGNNYPVSISDASKTIVCSESDGNVGIGGNVAPEGPVHIVGSIGRWVALEVELTDGTLTEILANGSFDVTSAAHVCVAVKPSAGTPSAKEFGISNGSSTSLYSADGPGDVVTMTVNADGSVDVQRTAGTRTYEIAIWMTYI